jgi:hypothetical protein
MKNLTRTLLIAFLCGSTLTIVQSCQKYEDGPMISLTSRTSRISNQWKIDNYKVNGTDYTSLVSSYTETFSKSGAYSYSWTLLNGEGTWAFQNNDKEVKLTGNGDQTSRTLFILKLEEKELWYYWMDGNDKHEYHLISQ